MFVLNIVQLCLHVCFECCAAVEVEFLESFLVVGEEDRKLTVCLVKTGLTTAVSTVRVMTCDKVALQAPEAIENSAYSGMAD